MPCPAADIGNDRQRAYYRNIDPTEVQIWKTDKTTVIYNAHIVMQDIPIEGCNDVDNGKPALERVMERQAVKTDKASGIVNEANRYETETMGIRAYPLELFRRVITVSLETMKIVRGLPKLETD